MTAKIQIATVARAHGESSIGNDLHDFRRGGTKRSGLRLVHGLTCVSVREPGHTFVNEYCREDLG
jgi:hypothetical protein